jgi:SAM-dependent methyltransferase
MASIKDEKGHNQGFEDTPASRLRLSNRATAITKLIPLQDPSVRILEIGCGTGRMAWEIATRIKGKVIGADISGLFIDRALSAYRLPNLDFQTIDAKQPLQNFFPEGFDFIVGNGILHHLYTNIDSVLSQLRKSLNPSGKLLFWEPNLSNPYVYLIFKVPILRKKCALEPDEMAFTSTFISQRLASAGFVHARALPRDFVLPNLPYSFAKAILRLNPLLERIPLLRWWAQSLFIST